MRVWVVENTVHIVHIAPDLGGCGLARVTRPAFPAVVVALPDPFRRPTGGGGRPNLRRHKELGLPEAGNGLTRAISP